MLIVNFVEAFERFLKEIASVCVNHLAQCVLDDRFDKLGQVKGSFLAAHFDAGSLGKALCESGTWLDCDEVNLGFGVCFLTRLKWTGSKLIVFFQRRGRCLMNAQFRYPVMSLLWQIRHTIVHNLGQIKRSPTPLSSGFLHAVKWTHPDFLVPTRDDVRYVKRFLDEPARTWISASLSNG